MSSKETFALWGFARSTFFFLFFSSSVSLSQFGDGWWFNWDFIIPDLGGCVGVGSGDRGYRYYSFALQFLFFCFNVRLVLVEFGDFGACKVGDVLVLFSSFLVYSLIGDHGFVHAFLLFGGNGVLIFLSFVPDKVEIEQKHIVRRHHHHLESQLPACETPGRRSFTKIQERKKKKIKTPLPPNKRKACTKP